LELAATIATITLQWSSRQGLSQGGWLRTVSCQQLHGNWMPRLLYNYPINFIDHRFV
jgi:hypothetical protein